jgi:DNA-binding response OmpR family regulator
MKKVLLIEDNLSIQVELTLMLQLENYMVITAEGGQRGFELAKELRPDLVICDINMPGLNGFEVLARIRENIVTIDTPFIFLTSRTDLKSIEFARELGADDYLVKPFIPSLFLRIIETQLIKRTSAIVIIDSVLQQN